MKQLIYLLLGIISITGCSKKQEVIYVETPSLRASYIYNHDSVHAFMDAYGEKNSQMAAVYFKQGEKLTESNPKKATWLMKRAITLNPQKLYYEKLGEHLLNTGLYNEAAMAYDILTVRNYQRIDGKHTEVYLFGPPDEDVCYHTIIASVKAFGGIPVSELYAAKELGVDIQNIKARLIKDPRFNFDPASETYKNLMLLFLSEKEIADYCMLPENFNKFISAIPEVNGGFNIGREDVVNFRYREDTEDGMDISAVEGLFFKEIREHPDQHMAYNTKYRFNMGNGNWGVVCMFDSSAVACPRPMRQTAFSLTVFDSTGKVLDNKPIAWHNENEIATCYSEGEVITITVSKRLWKRKYDKYDFDNEPLKTEQPVNQLKYRLTAEGRIEQM